MSARSGPVRRREPPPAPLSPLVLVHADPEGAGFTVSPVDGPLR